MAKPEDPEKKDVLASRSDMDGLLGARLKAATPERPLGTVSLFFNSNDLQDAWLAVAWSGPEA
jgi:hypothetical protein